MIGITLTITELCSIIFVSSLGGIIAGTFLIRTYVKSRGYKTKSQKELQRLSRWIEKHHPEVITEGDVVDIAIRLMAQEPSIQIPSETKIE